MPAPGIPYGRTALPTKTVDDAAYVGLSERMSQDSFRLGASHRAEQDAQSLASLIQVPDSGGVTGTTGYEGMLQPEPETSPSTPVSDSQEFGDTSVGDTAPRRMALQAMPTMPDLLSPSPRQPLSQQQGQSVDLPGTPESAPLSISFPASGGSGASLLPGAASASPASPPSPPAGGAIDNSSRQAFVTSAWPHMLEAAGGNRDAAEMMLAAAISENGSIGTGRPIWANNFFGIKGRGDAGSVTADTHEIVDGQRVDMPDAFAAYSTPTAGFRAFFDFLEANPRYERALGAYRQTGDAAQLFRDANTAGYATDPQWAAKVESIRRNQVAPIVAGVQTPAPSATQRTAEGRALAGEARQAGTLDTAGITKAYQGVPYVFGGAGGRSDMRLGAASDCAGFVASVWKNQYGLDLAAHTDTSYNQLKALGAHDVAESDARPGDVVYYMGAGTGGAITHHMGIYAGPGKVLDMSVSGGDGVRTRDIDHAGRHVILRDPRVNPEMPKQPLTPPPIVPSADSGGAPVSRADADALSLAAISDPSTGAEDVRVAQMPGQGYSDVLVGMGPDAQPPPLASSAPPVRDDYRNEVVQPIDPDQGPRELGYSLPPAPAAAEQPGLLQGIGQGIWDAGAGAAGAVQGAVTGAAGAVQSGIAGAGQAISDAYAVPPEQRPPQYSGPSYAPQPLPEGQRPYVAPTETEQAAFSQGIEDARAAEPLERLPIPLTGASVPIPGPLQVPAGAAAGALGALNVADQAVRARVDPRVWTFARDGIRRELFTPEQLARDAYLRGAMDPETGRRHVTLTPDEQDELQAMDQAVEQRYQQIKDDPDALTRYANASPAYAATSAVTDIALTPALGAAAGGAATHGAEAAGASARTARGIGYAADIAAQTAVDPTTPFTQGPLDAAAAAARTGVGAARRGVGAIRSAAADNAQRVAAADARMAAQGSTAAPGVFGLSGIEPDLPAVQGMRPRIIPPDVADSLDLPIRLPEDPRVIRAIEAAGGTVDERGTTLNVIRNQGPEAAGGVPTRGMTYHIAGPPGTPNPFTGSAGIGGSDRIEGPTRFRNPLFIQQEGGTGHLDDALAKLGVQSPADPTSAARLQGLADQRAREAARYRAQGAHTSADAMDREARHFQQQADAAASAGPIAGRREIDEQVNAIRRRTEPGSPERTAALEELVARYGGDPSVVPDLVRLRPSETESGYAIVENIIAENARKHGHDGVIYLGKGTPDFESINSHPRVVAAEAAERRAAAAADRLSTAHEQAYQQAIYEELGLRPGETPQELRARIGAQPRDVLDAARARAAQRPHVSKALDDWSAADAARVDAEAATRAAQAEVEREITPHQIEELGDTREGRNPTPGGTDQALNAAPVPPGYTLRPDIPRRAGRLPEGFTVERLPDGSGRWVLENDAGDWLHERTFPSAAEAQAFGEAQAAAPNRGPGSEIAQASAGALAPPVTRRDPFALATRAISEPLAGSIGGATIGGGLPAESDEERRANALRGAAIGAGGFPAATRLARGAARLAGAEARGGGALATVGGLPPVPPPRGPTPPAAAPGLFAQFPGVQGAIAASAQRAADMQARGLTKPSAVEWLKQLGFSGIFGPATGTGQVIGGALEVAGAQPKEALRALTTGQGGRYGSQVAEQMRALPEAWDGFWDVVLGRRGAAGTTAASGGTQQGTAKLSERVVNPLQHAAARVMEKSGEIWAEAPDAIFRPIFTAQGMRREADRIAEELGQGKAAADTLLAEAKQLHKHPGSAASPEAQRIVDAGQAYADELGYKGDPGKAASWLAKQSQRNDAVGLAASYAIPFPGMAGRTTRAALRVTPGVGLLPGVRAGRPMLGFDTIHDQAIGAVALAGMGTYAAQGGITGSGPADPEERKAMIAQGWQPNSMLVPSPLGTFYVPNRLFQRFGPILNAVGEAHDTVAYGKKDQTPSQLLTDAGKRIGTIVTDQTGLSGLSDIYDLLFGQAGFASQAPGTLGRAITRYTPGGGTVRAVAQGTDPEGVARAPDRWSALERQHEPGWAGSAAAFGEAVGQQLEQNIPGLRGDVPAGQDLFGRPLPNPQQGLGAVVPRTTTLRDEPIVRIYQEADVLPSSPKTELRVTSSQSVPPIPLMPAEQRLWNEKRGAVLLQAGQTILSDPTWTGAPLEARQKALQRIMDQAAKAADGQVLQAIGNDEITRRVNQAVSRKAG